MENPEDDPREYQQHMPGAFEDDGDGSASGSKVSNMVNSIHHMYTSCID